MTWMPRHSTCLTLGPSTPLSFPEMCESSCATICWLLPGLRQAWGDSDPLPQRPSFSLQIHTHTHLHLSAHSCIWGWFVFPTHSEQKALIGLFCLCGHRVFLPTRISVIHINVWLMSSWVSTLFLLSKHCESFRPSSEGRNMWYKKQKYKRWGNILYCKLVRNYRGICSLLKECEISTEKGCKD